MSRCKHALTNTAPPDVGGEPVEIQCEHDEGHEGEHSADGYKWFSMPLDDFEGYSVEPYTDEELEAVRVRCISDRIAQAILDIAGAEGRAFTERESNGAAVVLELRRDAARLLAAVDALRGRMSERECSLENALGEAHRRAEKAEAARRRAATAVVLAQEIIAKAEADLAEARRHGLRWKRRAQRAERVVDAVADVHHNRAMGIGPLMLTFEAWRALDGEGET